MERLYIQKIGPNLYCYAIQQSEAALQYQQGTSLLRVGSSRAAIRLLEMAIETLGTAPSLQTLHFLQQRSSVRSGAGSRDCSGPGSGNCGKS